ncbi:MAG: ion transporter [Fibrobacterota bacterium]|nr:ion transporter [Chitinispirillaceae bacterium]
MAVKQQIVPTYTGLKGLVESKGFNFFIMGLILISAVNVGLSTYPGIMANIGDTIGILDWIIIGFFCVEALLRISAEWPKPFRYFSDPWNIFDFTIVVLCLLPLDSTAVVAIRIVRLLRVMRLFRALPKLRILIRGIVHSMSSVGYVAILLAMHFFIFAVIGVSIFGQADAEHFGDLGKAFLTQFQVLTLENWPDVMAPVKEAFGNVGIAYFILFIVTGTMVVMNLFVGVIVGGMSEAIEETKAEKEIDVNEKLARVTSAFEKVNAEVNRLEARLVALNDQIDKKSDVNKKVNAS